MHIFKRLFFRGFCRCRPADSVTARDHLAVRAVTADTHLQVSIRQRGYSAFSPRDWVRSLMVYEDVWGTFRRAPGSLVVTSATCCIS